MEVFKLLPSHILDDIHLYSMEDFLKVNNEMVLVQILLLLYIVIAQRSALCLLFYVFRFVMDLFKNCALFGSILAWLMYTAVRYSILYFP